MANFIEELAVKLGLETDAGSFEKAEKSIEGLRLGLAGLATIAAAAGASLLGIAETTAKSAVEAFRTAQKIGTTAEAYQELKYAGDLAGVSTETLETGLSRLSRSAFNAALGSKEAGFAYRTLGVSVTGADGQIKSSDQLLEDVASRFQTLPDGIKKTALAQELFGRGGKELIPLLNKGRAGIEELRAEAQKYGVVLDSETIEASLRWEEQQKHLKAAVTGLRNAIGSVFLKRLTDVIDKIADWIAANRNLIATGVAGFIDGIKQLLEPLATVLKLIASDTNFWIGALIALAGILAVVNLPLLAVIGALLVLEDIYRFFRGEPSLLADIFPVEMRKSIQDFMHDVRDFFSYLSKGQLGIDLADKLEANRFKNLATPEEIKGTTPASALSPAQQGFSLMQGAARYFGGADNLVERVPTATLSPGQTAQATNNIGGSTTVNAPITINPPQGMDPKQVADRTVEAFEEQFLRVNREGFATADQQ